MGDSFIASDKHDGIDWVNNVASACVACATTQTAFDQFSTQSTMMLSAAAME